MYAWHCDPELEIASGWGPRRSRTTYEADFRKFLEEPPADLAVFAIEHEEKLVGRIELSEIDRENRRAALGLILGDKSRWGERIGTAAVILALDYAFTVANLERVFASVYAFNERGRKLMLSVGFTEEGTLRHHEIHNGAARDMIVFGILADEFRNRFGSQFRLPR